MLGPLDAVVAHLAFDDTGIGPQPAGGEDFEKELAEGFGAGVSQGPRGKNPGGTPWFGVPPGENG